MRKTKRRKGKNRKKGISPLIAAVLLIAFTVAVATLIMGWFTTFTRGTTESITNQTDTAIDCSSASITIDSVFVTAGTSGSATVVVKNNGFTDDLQLVSASLVNASGSTFAPAESLPVTNFDRGNVQTFTYSSVSLPSCPSDFSQVLVTTQCGGVSDTFDETPTCTS